MQKPLKHGRTGVFTPFKQYCCEHTFVVASQLNEQIVLLAIHFFSKAQLPGGGGAAFLASAAEKLAGSATAPANKTAFKTDDIRMFIPFQRPVSFYIAAMPRQAIAVSPGYPVFC